ncbi:hypothetical protein JOM56_014980 [Amanita muscaria]
MDVVLNIPLSGLPLQSLVSHSESESLSSCTVGTEAMASTRTRAGRPPVDGYGCRIKYDRVVTDYPDSHVILICFAIDDPDSLDDVQEKFRGRNVMKDSVYIALRGREKNYQKFFRSSKARCIQFPDLFLGNPLRYTTGRFSNFSKAGNAPESIAFPIRLRCDGFWFS